MANPPWPSTLPTPLHDGSATYTPQPNIVRTEMDAGAAKMRRRYTSVAEDFACTIKLDATQWATLDAFVKTTLADVLPFDWLDFRTNTTATYRFKSRPVAKPIPIQRYLVTLALEKLP